MSSLGSQSKNRSKLFGIAGEHEADQQKQGLQHVRRVAQRPNAVLAEVEHGPADAEGPPDDERQDRDRQRQPSEHAAVVDRDQVEQQHHLADRQAAARDRRNPELHEAPVEEQIEADRDQDDGVAQRLDRAAGRSAPARPPPGRGPPGPGQCSRPWWITTSVLPVRVEPKRSIDRPTPGCAPRVPRPLMCNSRRPVSRTLCRASPAATSRPGGGKAGPSGPVEAFGVGAATGGPARRTSIAQRRRGWMRSTAAPTVAAGWRCSRRLTSS